ncbi:hypothetical protein T459_25018 [Capsicum annuum]|uniref:Uncharacterized protein n=1 Tax=Capsicum annuum TaxID=4072 RepID=A0A2G2YJK3_CAPAN|nr:hypothetical protein T459_25018 [Capsicum annuum]
MKRYFSWYYASYALSFVVALTCLVYIQVNMEWALGFGAPILLMLFATLSIYLGTPFYVKLKPKSSLITAFFKFLNKACIVQDPQLDLSPDGEATDPWSLCTVDQVEELKALLKVVQILLTGAVLAINISQSSFPVLQANTMD